MMNEQPHTQAEFRKIVDDCLTRAQTLYGIDFGRVTVTFDLKGQVAGQAMVKPHPDLGRTYALRFNREAIRKDWGMMTQSTVPHEIAHLVSFADPSLGAENHNGRWARIATNLGDRRRGARCHRLELTPARRVTKFLYVNAAGTRMEVTSKVHRSIQTRTTVYQCRAKRCIFRPSDFQGLVA